jgi:hypothetical protein
MGLPRSLAEGDDSTAANSSNSIAQFALKAMPRCSPYFRFASMLSKKSVFSARPDWLAGHVGFEPANPSARYLIGIA